MAEKLCARCGELNVAQANFCSACGAPEFRETPPEVERRPSQGQAPDANVALWLSMPRVITLSVLTSGLYLFYWLYLTWKQLQSETPETHYPVWHALTLLLPIYGLFRLHRHMRVVQELALGAGVDTSLSPGLAVVLAVLNSLLGLSSARIESMAVGLLATSISIALTTTLVAWPQATLNRYWSTVRGTALQDMPYGVGERAFMMVGLLIWLNALLSLWLG